MIRLTGLYRLCLEYLLLLCIYDVTEASCYLYYSYYYSGYRYRCYYSYYYYYYYSSYSSNDDNDPSLGLIIGASVGGIIGFIILFSITSFVCRILCRKWGCIKAVQVVPGQQGMNVTTVPNNQVPSNYQQHPSPMPYYPPAYPGYTVQQQA